MANATGDGTTANVIFDTVEQDPLTAYNATTGIWTAPATGFYQFTTMTSVDNLTGVFNQFSMVVVTGGFSLANTINPGIARDANNRISLMISQSLFFNAGITLQVKVFVAGGTKTWYYGCFYSKI